MRIYKSRIFLQVLIGFMAAPCVTASALTASCEVTVQGEQSTVSTTASDTPYTSKFVDFENNFRFAMHVSHAQNLLKTYTYYKHKNRYVLTHLNVIPLDTTQCKITPMTSYVYSPELERELSYRCQITCATHE